MIREFISFSRPALDRAVLVLLGALALPILAVGHAQAQRKPAAKPQAEAAKPALVGQFGDWGAFATPQAKARTCYALSQPKTRAPNLNRDPAYVFITHRPAEKVRNEVAIIVGFDVKPDSKPIAEIGDEEFELVAKGANLWLRNAAEEDKFIVAMRKGARMTIKARSLRNNLTTDSYSLSGVSQALDRATKECP